MEIKHGATRTVILIRGWAVKIPTPYGWRNFLHGLLANHQERLFSKAKWPELCPVIWSLPLALIICMRRAAPLDMVEFESFDFDSFVKREYYSVPVENKLDSFGRLEGRIVAVDYGN